MRLLKSLLLASSCLLSSVSAADNAAAPDEGERTATAVSTRTREVYTMGFEAETSVFKMQSDTPKRVFIDRLDGKDLWEFTVDTPDYTVKTTDDEGVLLNTECKTIDGLTKEEIQEAARRVTIVWQKFKELCKGKYDTFVDIPGGAFEGISIPSFEIRMPNEAPHQKEGQVYPQLTYCLPLRKLSLAFMRVIHLAPKDDSELVEFFSDKEIRSDSKFNNHSDENLILLLKALHTEIELYTHKKEKKIQHLKQSRDSEEVEGDKQKFTNLIQVVEEQISDNRFIFSQRVVRIKIEHAIRTKKAFRAAAASIWNDKVPNEAVGLALLFSFYGYQLFCNNLASKETEPGPKPLLGVMSRLPFSEMYDNLEEKDKIEFKELIIDNLFAFFKNKIRRYKTCAHMQLNDNEQITLENWYESIINPERRIKNRDLLSPPPGCRLSPGEEPYGMGAFGNKNFIPGHALIEVRGYSRLRRGETVTTLDNFNELVKNESEWFFNQVVNHGESQ